MRRRFRTPHSLRGRLTLWHGLILGLTLITFTVAVYSLLARSLVAEIDRALVDRARPIHDMMQRDPRSVRRAGMRLPPPPNFASAEVFVQITTPTGEVLNASTYADVESLDLPPADQSNVTSGAPQFRTVQLGTEQVRLYSLPVIVQGQPTAIIHVGRDLASIERSLARMRLFAGSGLLVMLLCSGVVVWLTVGRALRPLEHLIVTAEAVGSSRDLAHRVAAKPAYDEIGRLGTTFNQMLERLETADTELRAAYSRLEHALDAQRRFVADASHELRTPLTTIRGNASLLRQFADVTPDDRAAALAQISQEAERMSRLVHDLLTLARADTGQPLRHTPVALGPLIEDVVGQARLLANGHTLTLDIGRSAEVIGDPDALRQLALILLDNAVKYSPNRGPIDVCLDADAHEARVKVADSGIGIAPDDLPQIFERFFRADRGRKAGGTGLGLSIARWIAEQHGGRIEASSTPGKGSTFVVHLPLARRDAPAAIAEPILVLK